MPQQEQRANTSRRSDSESSVSNIVVAPRAAEERDDVDELLGEVDKALEENEQTLKNFRQKGGE